MRAAFTENAQQFSALQLVQNLISFRCTAAYQGHIGTRSDQSLSAVPRRIGRCQNKRRNHCIGKEGARWVKICRGGYDRKQWHGGLPSPNTSVLDLSGQTNATILFSPRRAGTDKYNIRQLTQHVKYTLVGRRSQACREPVDFDGPIDT